MTDDLRRLAEAATANDNPDQPWPDFAFWRKEGWGPADAAYIAAASPDAIRALLDDRAAAVTATGVALDRLRDVLDERALLGDSLDATRADNTRLRAALTACGEDWPGEGGWHLLSCDATDPHWPVCEQARAALAAGEVE